MALGHLSLLVGHRRLPGCAAARLERTLRRAMAAPFYQGRVDRPDLAAFPILSREDLRRNADMLLVGDVPAWLRRRVATGGSSGAPVSLWLDRAISVSEWRYMTQQWAQVGYSLGTWRLVLRGTRLPPGRLYAVNRLRRELHLSLFDLRHDTIASYVRLLASRVDYFLHAYPSAALRLAQLCDEAKVELPSPRGLLLGSEGVSAEQIRYLGDVYRAPVCAWYGMTEKVLLGTRCTVSGRYHLHPDYGVAEIVDPDGRPVTAAGVEGRLLGTGLLNACAPLVRYDTGDVAAWAEGCPCGWRGQVLDRVAGRAQDVIRCPSGAEISVAALNLHTAAYRGVRQVQYRVEMGGQVTARVVADPATDLTRLKVELGARLPGSRLRVEPVDHLQPASNGKVPLLVRG